MQKIQRQGTTKVERRRIARILKRFRIEGEKLESDTWKIAISWVGLTER